MHPLSGREVEAERILWARPESKPVQPPSVEVNRAAAGVRLAVCPRQSREICIKSRLRLSLVRVRSRVGTLSFFKFSGGEVLD